MRKLLIVTFLALIVFFSGCIGSNSSATPTTTTSPVTQSQPKEVTTETKTVTQTQTVTVTMTRAPTHYPLTITDSLGRKVTIKKEPQRIVSLAPSITETLYFIGALDKVVGVTSFDDFPPGVQKGRTIIGGFSGPNIEVIASLKPDLIIGTSMHIKYLDKLEQIAPVIIVDPKNIDEIYEWIIKLGKVVNREEEAKGVVNYMKAIVEDIKTKTSNASKVKVFFLLSTYGGYWTAGKGTFIDSLISIAGGENIFHDVEGWKQVSPEEIVARDPEVIIFSAHAGIKPEDLCKTPLAETTAFKNGRAYMVSDDNLVSRPGPRIVLGLEEIAYFIHPEAFNYAYQAKAAACASS
ncbi:ABC transporter substrate-binding protein [Pyrococcus abyssi]|uniref:Iron (III) ABC transporter, periplasmic-binding protein, putative n=1 Tax=Pyrococcus abyssi (strain GE5 / Orsay) TaxID=272844 RepID=Q9V1B7_PYRAB|nr:ABC transporter substrate-binding protein [Pyrococcus abyssi]CAB49432.1 Iron (III) ABC transporter, periplasmic-binding protein, putative [Pyrococcus abyssi GE5]CCE69899.1 TPA: iron (III) ABC transporter, periplasmic-binding protein, putative [Pyrococcus abyssi GE5]